MEVQSVGTKGKTKIKNSSSVQNFHMVIQINMSLVKWMRGVLKEENSEELNLE